MEDSAFEAIYTGVYIFIFIAALTMTLYMFKNVNELAERSYEYGIIASGDRLIEAPEEPDKILNKSDIVSYYCNYIKQDSYDNTNTGITIHASVNITGSFELNFDVEDTENTDLLKSNSTKYYELIDGIKSDMNYMYCKENKKELSSEKVKYIFTIQKEK